MKKTSFKRILSILILLTIGIYYYPTPQKDFFELYPYDDSYSQSLKDFQSRITTEIVVDSVKWKYYSGGSGEQTILFLHGMGGSYDLWWQQVLEFEKDYRVITYSLPEEINTLKKSAEGIIAILEQEKVNTFIAVGTSMGGYITQYLANTISERISKVVFGNTFPPNNLIKQENLQKERIIPRLPEILLVKFADKTLKNEIVPAAKNSELLKAFLPSIPFSKKQFINRYAVVVDVFATNTIKTKHIPKLIIESDNDPLVQEDLRIALKDLYNDAQIYTFHNAGHFPYINEAKEYNTVLHNFLEQSNEIRNNENASN